MSITLPQHSHSLLHTYTLHIFVPSSFLKRILDVNRRIRPLSPLSNKAAAPLFFFSLVPGLLDVSFLQPKAPWPRVPVTELHTYQQPPNSLLPSSIDAPLDRTMRQPFASFPSPNRLATVCRIASSQHSTDSLPEPHTRFNIPRPPCPSPLPRPPASPSFLPSSGVKPCNICLAPSTPASRQHSPPPPKRLHDTRLENASVTLFSPALPCPSVGRHASVCLSVSPTTVSPPRTPGVCSSSYHDPERLLDGLLLLFFPRPSCHYSLSSNSCSFFLFSITHFIFSFSFLLPAC